VSDQQQRPTSSVAVLGWGLIGVVFGVVLALSGLVSDTRLLAISGGLLVLAAAVPVLVGGAAVGTRMGLREHAWDTARER
jgi:hypothetical protein